MIIAIRNETGIDLYLAGTGSNEGIRFRVTLQPPEPAEGLQVARMRAGESLGVTSCPEGVGVKMNVKGTGIAMRVARKRKKVDHIDEDGQIDGEETYLELTLLLLN